MYCMYVYACMYCMYVYACMYVCMYVCMLSLSLHLVLLAPVNSCELHNYLLVLSFLFMYSSSGLSTDVFFPNKTNINMFVCFFICMHMLERVCVRSCMCACVRML